MPTITLTPSSWAYKSINMSGNEVSDSNLYVGQNSANNDFYTRIKFPGFYNTSGLTADDIYKITSITVRLYCNNGLNVPCYFYVKENNTWTQGDTGDAMVEGTIGMKNSNLDADLQCDITGLANAILNYSGGFYLFIRPQDETLDECVQIASSVYTPVITIQCISTSAAPGGGKTVSLSANTNSTIGYTTYGSASWNVGTSNGAMQGSYDSDKNFTNAKRRVGMMVFTGMGEALKDSRVTQIVLKLKTGSSGTGSYSKTVYFYGSTTQTLNTSLKGSAVIGEALGQYTGAKGSFYGTTETITMDAENNPELFAAMKEYLCAGNSALVIFDSANTTLGSYAYTRNYMKITSATLTVTCEDAGIVSYDTGSEWKPCYVMYDTGTEWKQCRVFYDTGSEFKIINI